MHQIQLFVLHENVCTAERQQYTHRVAPIFFCGECCDDRVVYDRELMFHRIARCGRCVSVHAVLTVEFESSPGVEVSGEESADEGFEVMNLLKNLQQSTGNF